jgi:hypothetical protein
MEDKTIVRFATVDKTWSMPGGRRPKAPGFRYDTARVIVADGMFHSGPAAGRRATVSIAG